MRAIQCVWGCSPEPAREIQGRLGQKAGPRSSRITPPRGRCRPRILAVRFLVASCLVASGVSRADETQHPGSPYWSRNIFKRVVTDQKFLVTRWWPDEFKRPAFTAPLLAGTFLAVLSDDPEDSTLDFVLLRQLEERNSGHTQQIAQRLTWIGNGPVILTLLGTTYLVSRRTGYDRMAEASSLATESLIDAGIWIEVLKHATARVRPNQEAQGQFLQYEHPSADSFPSGHAMGAFSVATVFAEVYKDERWVAWVAYGGAGLIGTARIVLGRHFPSDVLVGGVLGNSIGRAVVARQRGGSSGAGRGRIAPTFDPSRRGYGLMYRASW